MVSYKTIYVIYMVTLTGRKALLTEIWHWLWAKRYRMSKLNLKAIPKCWWSFGSITWVIAAKLLSCVSTPTELSVHLKFPRYKFLNKNTYHKKLELNIERKKKGLIKKKKIVSSGRTILTDHIDL